MEITKKQCIKGGAAFGALTLVSTVIFYVTVVGYGGTNPLSVLFGWQWIYLAVASLVALVAALIKRNKALCGAALIVLASLAFVLVPARIVESSRLYITGDGGPAGPHMSCLSWEKSKISGAYGDDLGLCTLMSIPSYNKFLVDRSLRADQNDYSLTYFAMFVVNEAIIVGGLWLARRRLGAKKEA